MSNTFRLEGDLIVNLANLDNYMRRAIVAAANYVAPQAEAHMKTTAKWTDRTGAARNGLRAKVETGGDTTAIILYHSVHYGIWLELRWGGKYAVIEPTVQHMAPVFVQTIGRLAFNA